jgi:hypothetical protein
MSRATPDQIIAHADLLHAVDRLLAQAQIVREKRDILEQLWTAHTQAGPPDKGAASTAAARKGDARA